MGLVEGMYYMLINQCKLVS